MVQDSIYELLSFTGIYYQAVGRSRVYQTHDSSKFDVH